jgi:hypothetical protein
LLDRVRKLPAYDVVQGDGVQDCPRVHAQRDPHPLQRLSRASVGDFLRPFPAYAEKLAFYRADDVRNRYLVRRPGEPETAVRPALAANEPASAQLGQDGLVELSRDALRLGELLSRDTTVLRGGKLNGCTQRIIGAGCRSYKRYYAASRPALTTFSCPGYERTSAADELALLWCHRSLIAAIDTMCR